MSEALSTLVVLGGLTVAESRHRVDAMLELYSAGVAEHVIVTGAFWAFTHGQNTEVTMAQRMKEYAECHGMAAGAVSVADRSFDTIGDAIAVKDSMRTEGWRDLGLVTTESHLPRSTAIFTHVLGPEYNITPISAGGFPGRGGQRMYEMAASVLSRQVLRGTTCGDDRAIRERLFSLVPGYASAGRMAIAANHLRSVLGVPLQSLV